LRALRVDPLLPLLDAEKAVALSMKKQKGKLQTKDVPTQNFLQDECR